MGKLEYFKELEYRLRGLPERERQNILAVYEELFQKAEENGKSEEDIVDSLGFPRVPNWDAIAAPGGGSGSMTGAPAGGAAAFPRGAAPGGTGTGTGAARLTGTSGPAGPTAASAPGFPGGGAAADPLRDPHAGFIPPHELPLYREPGFFPPPPPYRQPVGSCAKPWIAALALAFFNVVFILGPFVGLCGALAGLWAATVALLLSPLFGLIGTGIPRDSTTLLLYGFGSLGGFGAGLMMSVVVPFLTKWFFKLTWKYLKFNWQIIKGA